MWLSDSIYLEYSYSTFIIDYVSFVLAPHFGFSLLSRQLIVLISL